MRFSHVALLGAVGVVAAACSDNAGKLGVTDPGPLAQVRFINAVSDTGAVTFRFVDKLENLPTFIAVPFRIGSGLYQGVAPGARHVRVFPLDTTVAGASTRLVDTTLTLDANRKYTIVYVGQTTAASGTPSVARLLVIPDTIPQPPADQVALRVIDADPTLPSVDVYIGNSGSDVIASPVVPPFTGLSYGARTPYVNLPARPRTSGALYTFSVTDAGSTTALFSATPNEPGAPAVNSISAQAGVQIPGSVMTAVILPAALSGTRASTSSNTTPTVAIFLDNIPGLP